MRCIHDMLCGKLNHVGPRNYALDGVKITQWEGATLGVVWPIEKHWEPILQCT